MSRHAIAGKQRFCHSLLSSWEGWLMQLEFNEAWHMSQMRTKMSQGAIAKKLSLVG